MAVPVLAFSLAGLTVSGAQPPYRPGDVIIGASDGNRQQNPILGVTPKGVLYTLVPSAPFTVWAIAPSANNRDLLAAGLGLARIAPDGTVTRLFPGPPLDVIGLDVDGTGNVILTQSLLRAPRPGPQPSVLKLTGQTTTTLYMGTQIPRCFGAGIDLRSGDLIFMGLSVVSQTWGTALMRASLQGASSLSTLNLLGGYPPPGWYGFPRHDPETDAFLLARSGGWIERLSLRAPGAITTLNGPMSSWVLFPGRDPADGCLLVPTFDVWPPYASSRVVRFDPAKQSCRTVTKLPSQYPFSATVAGSRHLCGGNEVWPGQGYSMLVSSPAEPGAAYAIALAFDFFPGFRLADGRKICLNPDPLFFWSLGNTGPFSGFRGALDARGEAIATVAIPGIPALSGLRFFAAAVTVVNHRISVISAPLGVTIH